METHEQDPTADEAPDPWDEFRDRFDGLGDRLKETYRRVSADGGPTEDEIKDALGTLVAAWDQVAESVSTALQDPDVRTHLKAAAGSFAAAVGNTISELGSELTEPGQHASPGPSEEE